MIARAGRPSASCSFTPVSCSATGFMKLTFPARSTVMTASATERNVVENHRSRSRSLFSISCLYSESSIALRSAAEFTGLSK